MSKKALAIKGAAKMGRPVTIGATEFIGAKVPPALVKRIDAWGKAHGYIGRSVAVRSLVEKGLGLRPRAKPKPKAKRSA